MSAEDETTGSAPQDDAGEIQATPPAKKAPAAKKPGAEAEPAAGETPDEEKPAPKKPRRKLRVRREPAADSEPVAADKPTTEEPAAAEETARAKEPKAAKESAAAKESTAKEPAAKEAAASKEPAEPKHKPAPRVGRGAKKAPRRRVVRAHARYVHTSARKARMVCGHLRGKSVQEARAILAFTPRDVARDWSKLLESAVANAESNHELLEDDLIVREAYADEGPTIKRFRPRAMGRATPIRKRTSHLTITLTPGSQPGPTKR